jgi:hypothetical protein
MDRSHLDILLALAIITYITFMIWMVYFLARSLFRRQDARIAAEIGMATLSPPAAIIGGTPGVGPNTRPGDVDVHQARELG